MSEELEQSVSDVSEGSSSSTESTSSNDSQREAQATAEAKPAKENYVPYDRFKELVDQKNQFVKQFEESQKRYAEMEKRLHEFQGKLTQPEPKPESDFDKVLKELRVANPVFAKWVEQQNALQKEVETYKQMQAQEAANRGRTEISSAMDKLHSEHKVPDNMKDTYRALVKDRVLALEAGGAQLGLQDLPRIYKEVHAVESKRLEDYKRSILAEYAKEKKTDSKVPTTKPGQAPKQGQQQAPKFSKDRDEAKRQIVKMALEGLRSGNDI